MNSINGSLAIHETNVEVGYVTDENSDLIGLDWTGFDPQIHSIH